MALFADYTKTTWSESDTETETLTITLPDNLNPEHQYYEQRGQTIQETVPRQIETTTVLQNVYIVIHGYNFYKFWTDDNGNVGYDVQYKIYNNKQQYLDDPMDWVDEGDILGGFYPITSSTDIRSYGYEILKSQTYLANITDD
jgi:hypothetical protein